MSNAIATPVLQEKPRAIRDVLIENIRERMKTRNDIFFLSADFGSPALDKLRADNPDRFINVGIAEANLINVSTGLALEGFTVFAYAIAPFITMRCYEQIRVNLSVLGQERGPMNVNLIGVGAGFSYDVSGPTHHCLEDLAVMRVLPGILTVSPSDTALAAGLADLCIDRPGIKYLRLDGKPQPNIYSPDQEVNFQKGFHQFGKGKDGVVVTTGFMTQKVFAMLAEDAGLAADWGHIDMLLMTYFDEDALVEALRPYKQIVTVEEGFIGVGGMDTLIKDVVMRRLPGVRVESMGLAHRYFYDMGSREHIHELAGVGRVQIEARLRSLS